MAARIQLRGSPFDPMIDLPIHSAYRDQLADAGMVIKNELRWLNALTGWVHPGDLDVIASLPFVDSLKPVVIFRRSPDTDVGALDPLPRITQTAEDVFDYGNSRAQLALIGANNLHAAGLTGRGVRVGFMDTGFSLSIRAFECLDIRGTRDFINGDTDVGDGEAGQMRHGTQTLSLCAGFDEGEIVGVAPGAEYVVAKTELVDAEIRAEEDNWVAGLEWLDSMGCDIVSSSLGYTDWYTDADYDGNTAPSTIAADLAAARGLLVVNAAGNAGCGDGDIRLIVPADGDSVLTVGASTFSGERATFSSCGPTTDGRIKPDVIAPGQGVWTALPNTGMYQPGNGTSFSTPLVSGVCALLLQHDPTLTPFGLITLLRSTADRAIKPMVTYGWGLVQATKAAGLDTNSIIPNRQFDCVATGGHVELWPNPGPDPATSETVIAIVGGTRSNGTFRIFTIAGARVFDGELSAGRATWDGRTAGGSFAAPAVYLVHVAAEHINEIVKLAWLPRD
jgi:subtilisin family serine protease